MDPSIPFTHITVIPEPIRDAGCEVALPLTSDEVDDVLLMEPRVGERPHFMSQHDSNAIRRAV